MKQPLPALLLLAALTAACNRPASAPPVAVLQTGVAATLTAAPPQPATRTSPPSATPSLTRTPTLSPTPTPVPSGTVGPSPTLTLPPLPTDDPRFGLGLNLAAPSYRDDFSQRFTWGEPVDDNVANVWQDDHLKTADLLADPFIWWSTTISDADAGDFFAEVTAEIRACTGKDAAGFSGRVGGANLDSGYTLEVSCDGHYRLREFAGGSADVLRDWTAAEAILKGPNAANRLGLLVDGDRVTPFANGIALGPPVQDSSLAFGSFALYAMARETPGVVVNFDDFALWHLSP
jgi:hypothetical protein